MNPYRLLRYLPIPKRLKLKLIRPTVDLYLEACPDEFVRILVDTICRKCREDPNKFCTLGLSYFLEKVGEGIKEIPSLGPYKPMLVNLYTNLHKELCTGRKV